MQQITPAVDGTAMPPIFAPARTPLSPADAYATIEDELDALPEHAILPPCLDLRYAAQTAMETARRMEALLPELAMLPEFDVGPVRRLAIYAAAALYTEWMLELPKASPSATHSEPAEAVARWLAPRRARARAYTLLVHAYDECRRGATFLRWCHGDLDRFVPPLHPTWAHVELDSTRHIGPHLVNPPSTPPTPPSRYMADTITAL